MAAIIRFAYGLAFQLLPRDLANVNARKTMFDPYSEMISYHFPVGWYDYNRTDIFHDFTAKNKIKNNLN